MECEQEQRSLCCRGGSECKEMTRNRASHGIVVGFAHPPLYIWMLCGHLNTPGGTVDPALMRSDGRVLPLRFS